MNDSNSTEDREEEKKGERLHEQKIFFSFLLDVHFNVIYSCFLVTQNKRQRQII